MRARPRGHRTWTSLTGPSTAATRRRGRAVEVLCGERLDDGARTALAAMVQEENDHGRGVVPDLVIVEDLCARPERVCAFWRGAKPEALVVVACTQTGASRAVAHAVADGLDTARVAAVSLAPALALGSPDARSRWVVAACRAASRRARLLAGQPNAARTPWQAGQTLGRRMLLGDLRGSPSRSAHIDSARCLGAERCGRCRTDCPVGAIRGGAVPQVDLRACVSCGRCVTTCPTGAISMPGADLAGLAVEADTLVAAGVTDLVITCERRALADDRVPGRTVGGPQAVVSLPCVAMFPPGARLRLSAGGTRLRTEPCADCDCGEAVRADARFVDRLLSVIGAPSRPPTPVSGGEGEGSGWREPVATNTAIAALLTSSADPCSVETSSPIVDVGAPTRVVQVDGARCTLCGSCALACPTTALAFDAATPSLAVDSSQCSGCGQCAAVCPETAVTVVRGVDICAVARGPTPVHAFRGEQPCSRCGATVAVDPMVVSVQRRLAAQGKPPALIASLLRCPACSTEGP